MACVDNVVAEVKQLIISEGSKLAQKRNTSVGMTG